MTKMYVNEAWEGCEVLSKTLCWVRGGGWSAVAPRAQQSPCGLCPIDLLCWELVLSSLAAEGPREKLLKPFCHIEEGR